MRRSALFFVLAVLSSFAWAQVDHYETFVHEDSTWRYLIPTAEPDTAWTTIAFVDTAWSEGPGGFGYADGDDATLLPTCVSVYIRQRFSMQDTQQVAFGLFDVDYDDGFVAYLNGVEIARSGMGNGPVAFDALADPTHEAVMFSGGVPERYIAPGYVLDTLLRTDSNVVAVQVHNSSANSSDMSARAWFSLAFLDAQGHGGTAPPAWFTPPVQLDSTLLPLVVIEAGTSIPNEPKVMADLRIIYNGDGQYQRPTDPGNIYAGKAGVERRGSESLGYPQASYGLQLRDSVGTDHDVELLGMPAEHDWVLLNAWNDKSFARNVLAFETARHMGHYAPRMRLCEVVVDNDYKGIALLGERIKRDAQRVAISRLDTMDEEDDAVTGGYIWKVDDWAWGQGWTSNYAPVDHPDFVVRFLGFYPRLADITIHQTHYLKQRVRAFEEALHGYDFEDPILGFRPHIDAVSFIDHFLVNELARNEEGFNRSCFFHKDRDSVDPRIKAGPVWDFDHGWKDLTTCPLFENTDGSGWAHRVNDCDPGTKSPAYFVRMLADTVFASQVGCMWQSYRGSFLTESWLHGLVDSVATVVASSQARHFARFPIIGANNGTPEVEPVAATWQAELDDLKAWISLRLQWLDANLPACTSVGLSANEEEEAWSIYPVPAAERVHITGPVAGAVRVELMDTQGRVVRTSSAASMPLAIELGDLVPGVFLAKVSSATGTVAVLRVVHR